MKKKISKNQVSWRSFLIQENRHVFYFLKKDLSAIFSFHSITISTFHFHPSVYLFTKSQIKETNIYTFFFNFFKNRKKEKMFRGLLRSRVQNLASKRFGSTSTSTSTSTSKFPGSTHHELEEFATAECNFYEYIYLKKL